MQPNINATDAKRKINAFDFAHQMGQLTKCRVKSVYWDHNDTGLAGTANVLHGQEMQADHIIKESRFADVLVIDADVLEDGKHNSMLSFVTKSVLTNSECPVIVAPSSFNSIEEIIFAYDGSASAVYAIKQFTALFPTLTNKRLTVLQINRHEGQAIKDRQDILELLQRHYSSIGFRCLVGDAATALYQYLADKENAIVVIGAFGSRNFILPYRQSTAEPLINTIELPIFTAHRS